MILARIGDPSALATSQSSDACCSAAAVTGPRGTRPQLLDHRRNGGLQRRLPRRPEGPLEDSARVLVRP